MIAAYASARVAGFKIPKCAFGSAFAIPAIHEVTPASRKAIESTSATDRTTLKLLTNGSNWEVGARGSAASPANAFYIYDNAANAYRQVIDSSGNVLLGGSTSATGTASQNLQVNSGAYVSGSEIGRAHV